MLTINIGATQHYDEASNEFVQQGGVSVDLEHSLVSLSKWESKYQIPFLTDAAKTAAQLLDYVRFMVVTPRFDLKLLERMTEADWAAVGEYINSSQTATTFGSMPQKHGPKETITSELVYYWMTAFNIPSEYQYWHLSRLFALIRICNVKQQPPKKLPRQEVAQRYRDINRQRLEQLGTTG
jgi:hypothetical protein